MPTKSESRKQRSVIIAVTPPESRSFAVIEKANDLSQQIATAALKIAAVNHYLVGFDLVEAEVSVLESALHHLAQAIWNADVDDIEFLLSIPLTKVRSSLKSWIGFQRAAIALRDGDCSKGLSNDQHRMACEQGDVYAREHFENV